MVTSFQVPKVVWGGRGDFPWKFLKGRFSLSCIFLGLFLHWDYGNENLHSHIFHLHLTFSCFRWRKCWNYHKYCTLYCNLVQMSWRIKTMLQGPSNEKAFSRKLHGIQVIKAVCRKHNSALTGYTLLHWLLFRYQYVTYLSHFKSLFTW